MPPKAKPRRGGAEPSMHAVQNKFISEIHQVYPYADLPKCPFPGDVGDAGLEELAGVHESCKDDVVFFRNVAQLLVFSGKNDDGVIIELVIFAPQG